MTLMVDFKRTDYYPNPKNKFGIPHKVVVSDQTASLCGWLTSEQQGRMLASLLERLIDRGLLTTDELREWLQVDSVYKSQPMGGWEGRSGVQLPD